MVIKELLTLPPWVDFEGINFQFKLFNDGGTEMRMVYEIDHVGPDSVHYDAYEAWGVWKNKLVNPIDPPPEAWLRLYEKLTSDADLLWAIRDCWYWLQDRGLLGKEKPYG